MQKILQTSALYDISMNECILCTVFHYAILTLYITIHSEKWVSIYVDEWPRAELIEV